MRKILTLAALATLLAVPAFAFSSDPEIRAEEEWRQLVEQVQAKHADAMSAAHGMKLMAHSAAPTSATDGMPAAAGDMRTPHATMSRPYATTLEILQDK